MSRTRKQNLEIALQLGLPGSHRMVASALNKRVEEAVKDKIPCKLCLRYDCEGGCL